MFYTFNLIFLRILHSTKDPIETASKQTLIIIAKIVNTLVEKFVILKNSGITKHATSKQTKDKTAVNAFNFVRGMQSHNKFKNPEKVRANVTSVSYSEAESMSNLLEPTITTVETENNIIKALGIDFFST